MTIRTHNFAALPVARQTSSLWQRAGTSAAPAAKASASLREHGQRLGQQDDPPPPIAFLFASERLCP